MTGTRTTTATRTPTSHRRRRRRPALASVAALVVGTVAAASGAPLGPLAPIAPAAAQSCDNEVNGQTCHAGAGHPGETVDLTGEVGPRVHASEKKCLSGNPGGHWEDIGPPFAANLDFDPGEPPQEGARYWVFLCPNHIDGILNPVNWEGGGWGITPPEQPPTPADVLPPLWQEVQARLQNPQLSLAPVEGTETILDVPTFVQIVNPQAPTTYMASASGGGETVTVWIAVVPEINLHPGEPEAGSVPCDADGTAFNAARGAPSPDDQAAAADGSCVHTYQHRSQAGWGGDVTITWNVWWDSSVPGQAGTLDAAPSVTPFDRVVEEVNTLVTDYSD